MRVLLVGELNPYGADPSFALFPLPEHASGGRLARILGLSRTDYLRRFDRMNLCAGKWSLPKARLEASIVIGGLAQHQPVILLGAKVCAAFGVRYLPFEEVPTRIPVVGLWVLPHPSGLNRIWNTPNAESRARRTYQEVILAGS